MIGMTFSEALMCLKNGHQVARMGWNGRGMYLYLVPASKFMVNREPLNRILPEGTMVDYCAHIDMKAADDTFVPWVASQTDILTDDWLVV
jgi:Protein of unknown function (DUF2829)